MSVIRFRAYHLVHKDEMPKNQKPLRTTLLFWGLFLSVAIISIVRVLIGETNPATLFNHSTEYAYEQTVTINSAPGEFTLAMYLPASSTRATVAEEEFHAAGIDFRIEDDPAGRRLLLRGGRQQHARIFRFTAAVATRGVTYELDREVLWGEIKASEAQQLAQTELIQTGNAAIAERLAEMLGVSERSGEGHGADLWDTATWQRNLEASGLAPLQVLQEVFDYCNDEIAPASFSGTTDALTALRLGESSCGGKSRLMVAFCRTAGIPSRLVGGVILGNARAKRTSHIWLECRIAGQWIPFDPLNDHYASVPANYLPLYWGDHALIRHSRGLAFDYGFSSHLENIPSAWSAGTLDANGTTVANERSSLIPLLRRHGFSIILLAPFALLLVVFSRQVLGFESIGMFLPVLLGFCITQTGWLLGGTQIAMAIFLGAGMRLLVTRFEMLHVPRTAIMIVFVVLLFLIFSFILERFGLQESGGTLILPLAALAMTVERFVAIAIDKGSRQAFSVLLQTFVLVAGCALVLSSGFLKILTVTFPEVLLLVIAEIVMIGSYRGLRLREQWRFRSLIGDGSRGEATV